MPRPFPGRPELPGQKLYLSSMRIVRPPCCEVEKSANVEAEPEPAGTTPVTSCMSGQYPSPSL